MRSTGWSAAPFPPQIRLSHEYALAAGTWYAIAIPDLGDAYPWTLAVWPAGGAGLELCR